jgi:membrane protease YdiL (CAAX protease family)
MESSLESPTPPASLPAGEAPLVVRRPSPFDRLRARALIGWFIAWSMIVTVAAIAVARLVEGPGRHVNLDDRLSGILSALVMIGVALALARGARLDWRRLFGRWPTRAMLPLALVMVPVALFTYVTTIAVYLPLSYVAPRFVRWILAERGLFAVSTVPQWVLLMVVGAIAAPVSEEIIFRGLLLHRWARRWGTTTGVVASSVLFAMLHQEWVGHFAFGVALSALYLRTRSLWLPILAHAANNAFFLAGELPRALGHAAPPVDIIADLHSGLPWLAPLALATVVTAWLYLRALWAPGQLRAVLQGEVPYEANAGLSAATSLSSWRDGSGPPATDRAIG